MEIGIVLSRTPESCVVNFHEVAFDVILHGRVTKPSKEFQEELRRLGLIHRSQDCMMVFGIAFHN